MLNLRRRSGGLRFACRQNHGVRFTVRDKCQVGGTRIKTAEKQAKMKKIRAFAMEKHSFPQKKVIFHGIGRPGRACMRFDGEPSCPFRVFSGVIT